MPNTHELIEKIVETKIQDKVSLVESKLRNSFRAVKEDNDQIKKSLANLTEAIRRREEAGGLKEEVRQLGLRIDKRVTEDDQLNAKLDVIRKEISKEGVKDSVKKDLSEHFDKKISNSVEKLDKRAKELREEMGNYKKSVNAIFESNSSIIEKEYADKEKEIDAKIDRQIKSIDKYKKDISFEFGVFKRATNSQVNEHKLVVDNNSSRIEAYSHELQEGYERSKKEIKSAVEKKIDVLQNEDIRKLQGQISYLKGRINGVVGKEVSSTEKPVEVKSKKVMKVVAPVKTKDSTLFSNLISLLADESPEVKVNLTKKVVQKPAEKPKKIVQKLEIKEDKGFFNSIIKSLADE